MRATERLVEPLEISVNTEGDWGLLLGSRVIYPFGPTLFRVTEYEHYRLRQTSEGCMGPASMQHHAMKPLVPTPSQVVPFKGECCLPFFSGTWP